MLSSRLALSVRRVSSVAPFHIAIPVHNLKADMDDVPVPHMGVCLSVDQFHALAKKVQSKGIPFIVEPHLRFVGRKGEQWTMFFKDPSGNNLEFKAMTNHENLFAKYVEE
ncbi:hypothetical protein DYB25_003763 [Aphanomyces astaci]|uniref:Glyoxalase/fosfomycin resistance/dioxygenase domain-containing protein n=1 Tax=Aphanomyces astaci TaxID=112090 RepID=A0A397F2A8_APHAT|nr:hypothetical protein DYB25_003763 [Aphanomyces astaci]RHY51193.1 hypothetical protein DYB34_007347 [Aphanomyces astaci]RHY72099.1 hypothetical protein DYB30_000249 [Aphanomyces astaci]RHZ12841.1 hypothetical protein DYB31_008905 [Aphanomyces astaci]RHZ22713.1 hypothetical protein DYB26_000624 [Aphanomyces astaci]